MSKKLKTLLDVGVATLCTYIRSALETAKQAASAASTLSGAMSKTIDEMNDILNEKQDIMSAVDFVIPTSGWRTDNTVDSYPNYYDVTVDGLLESDIVDVNTLPNSADVAWAAKFCAVESAAGKFRLRCKHIPTAPINAQYHITSTQKYTPQEGGGNLNGMGTF